MKKNIPYGRQLIENDDIASVVETLKSAWLTTGPIVEKFENTFAKFTGAKHAVSVSNGTAALHAAIYALDIKPGDEIIVPVMSFVASANCIVFQGGTPVFVDVNSDTLLIDINQIEEKINSKTRAIIAVDFAGQPCSYNQLRSISEKYKIHLIADASHALGAEYKGEKVGNIADLTTFSFHPVKHITTGEGGMVTTDNPEFANRMKRFRNHCIDTDFKQRGEKKSYYYQVTDLGYNYRLTDLQCALGLSQLSKLPQWLHRRKEIAEMYNDAFKKTSEIIPLKLEENVSHAYHLFVIKLENEIRDKIFLKLRDKGVGVNVHYLPIHLHPFYQNKFTTNKGDFPVAEKAYNQILSLPIFADIKNDEVDFVIEKIFKYI